MVAAPAPVAAAPELRVLFDGLDANSDGMIELAEFLPAGPGVVSRGSEKSLIGPGAGPIQAAPAGPFPAGTAAPFPKAAFEAEFLAQDADKNAKVSYDEFTAYHRKMLRSGFDGLDRNKDGGIDKAEYAAHGTSKKLVGPGDEPSMSPGGDFTHFDRDGNGRIDWEEFGNPQAG